MNNSTETFASIFLRLAAQADLVAAFDDFLTYCICRINLDLGIVFPTDTLRHIDILRRCRMYKRSLNLKQAYQCLLQEMQARNDVGEKNDVLGLFYQQHILVDDSTSWMRSSGSQNELPLCERIAEKVAEFRKQGKPIKFYEAFGGSGFQLITAADCFPDYEGVYAMDACPILTKIVVLNLLLHGISKAEVVCTSYKHALEIDQYFGWHERNSGICTSTKETAGIWQMLKQVKGSPDFIQLNNSVF